MSEPVRIAVIEESAGIGGAEVNLLNLCRFLDRDRFRYLVVVPTEGPLTKRLVALGVDYYVLPRARLLSTSFYMLGRKIFNPMAVFYNMLTLLPYILKLRNILRQMQINIVHTNSMMAHLYGGISARLAGVPCIWHMQDIVDNKCFGMVLALMNFLGGVLPTKIVAISQAVAKMYSGESFSRVRVIYNGSDVTRFAPGPASEVLRAELGLEAGSLVVGIVGRLVRWKGHPEFLRMAALVAKNVPNVRFLIIGDTTFGPGSYGNELRELVETLGLAEKVVFTGGRDDVPELMRLLDVFIHASITPEPFGLVITEAMAAGLPVIASSLGGPKEIVQDGRNGFLVDPRDHRVCADSVIRLCQDEKLRTSLGEAARQTVVERFSITNFSMQMADVYRQLANRFNDI